MIEALAKRYPRWQKVRLVVLRPAGTPEPHSINEVVTSLFHGLQALGCCVDIRENQPIDDGTNIYFRAHLLPFPRVSEMPPGSIVYNFEQIFDQSPWVGRVYRDLLSRVTVWDYSRRNLAAIAAFADPRRLHLVPLGYTPQLTRIPPAPVEDIDVLFYGVVNARRRAILAGLGRAGLRLHVETRIGGAARDGLIARAKLVLNLHFYPTAIFEIVRVSHLLSNRKAVVGECGQDTEIDDDIREAIASAPYERLCETVHDLLGDDTRRQELARRGQEIFARRRPAGHPGPGDRGERSHTRPDGERRSPLPGNDGRASGEIGPRARGTNSRCKQTQARPFSRDKRCRPRPCRAPLRHRPGAERGGRDCVFLHLSVRRPILARQALWRRRADRRPLRARPGTTQFARLPPGAEQIPAGCRRLRHALAEGDPAESARSRRPDDPGSEKPFDRKDEASPSRGAPGFLERPAAPSPG
jgi:hypothetical protein